MDKRIDLTLNRDFNKGNNHTTRLNLNFSSPTDNEINCGFPTGSLDEIKSKRRIITFHHATEGDKPECLRCGKRIIYGDMMTCKGCDEDFENERLESDMSFYFTNRIKNKDIENSHVKGLFGLK